MKNTTPIVTTSNQTTLDSPKFVSKAISLGILPVKLLYQRDNESVKWKITTTCEYHEKHDTNRHNKQPNHTRLTQLRKESNLSWNRSHQTIALESQPSCRMKNDDEHEITMKHTTPIVTTNKQTTLDSLNCVRNPISLGIIPLKLFMARSK